MIQYEYCVLGLTSKCNLHCPNCFRLNSKINYIQTETLKNVLKFLKFVNCKYLCISGGEPLLHPQWENIIDFFFDNGIIPLLSTNASLITNLGNPVFKKIAVLSIPLDGYDEKSNDTIRGAGHFSKVNTLIEDYNQDKYCFLLKVNTVINEINFNSIENFIERFKNRPDIIWKLFEIATRSGNACTTSESNQFHVDFGKLMLNILDRKDIKCKVLSLHNNHANNYLLITADGEVYTPELDSYKHHFSVNNDDYASYLDKLFLSGNQISNFYPNILK